MTVHTITKDNFQKEVLNADTKVLLDFWAPWCSHCRMIGPALEQIAAERPDVKVCKVNIEEEMELASEYHVSTIPLLLVLEKGQILNKSTGSRPKAQILSML